MTRLQMVLRGALLFWLGVVIWAAFFFIPPAAGFQGQSSRIVVFHVPTAWVATLAFLVSFVVSIRYLRKRLEIDDIRAASSARLGLAFAVLATITGSVFSRIEWGMFWNWDPRQISIAILLLIYLAYFALRGAIVDPQRRATLAAVYAILAFVTVPFLVFVVPRIYTSLHPDVIGEASSGRGGFDGRYLSVLLASLAGFTALFGWLFDIECRLKRASCKEEELW